MKTNKLKISRFDKISFPVLNVLMLALVFALLQDLLQPKSNLEWVAIVLMCAFVAMPIANMNRKEILESIEIDQIIKERNEGLRKSA